VQDAFRIGDAYHIEPSLNRVTGPNGITRLEPKVMLVLVCLADRAGQMVPKDHLFHTVWAHTAVGDDVLTRAVSELRRLFDDDPKQPRVIETIPKSGYRLIASVHAVPSEREFALLGARDGLVPAEAPEHIDGVPESRRARFERWPRPLAALGIAAAVGLALAGVWLLRTPRTPAQAMRIVPLTALAGSEFGPAFSPDGRQVAFAWDGDALNNLDIYVKLVGSSEVRRLTTDPGTDLAAQWSPDGRQIAYVRAAGDFESQRVRVMSSLGGSDRQVSDFPVWLPTIWAPDGRDLVAGRAGAPDQAHPTNGIYVIPLDGSEPRAITRPAVPAVDQAPAFSPDGRRLAYTACDEYRTNCRVQVLDLDASLRPVGAARRLTGVLRMPQSGMTWSSDGRFIIFNAEEVQLNYLWRVSVDGGGPPERIEVAGAQAFFPSMSPVGRVLGFTRKFRDEDVYRFEPSRAAQPVARSSVYDGNPQFSPDGRRIAFCSLRSGDAMQVWVANADGSMPEQLTHGPGRFQGGPSWSPDGRQIAFEASRDDGHPHIWTVDADGGTPRQITDDAGDQMDPSWSRDGQWIYFSWTRPGDHDIWRTRRAKGSKERVTHGGGILGWESMDGKTLLYTPKLVSSSLVAQPLASGAPRTLIQCIAATAVAVNATGIYYVPCAGLPPDPDPPVHVFDPATGAEREIGRLEKFQYDSLPSGFAVSPDGRTILYGRLVRDEADLFMIANFN